jgi:hypothetical protein
LSLVPHTAEDESLPTKKNVEAAPMDTNSQRVHEVAT